MSKLTRREAFAIRILASMGLWTPLRSGETAPVSIGPEEQRKRAVFAVEQADALIAELDKEGRGRG